MKKIMFIILGVGVLFCVIYAVLIFSFFNMLSSI